MSEEQTTATEEQAAGTSETPANSEETSTVEDTGLLGIKSKEEEPKEENTLDPELFDTQTKKLREDIALEKLKSFKDEQAKYEKQIKDLRRIVSKGKAPEDISEYQTYKPDSKYEKYFDFADGKNEGVKEVLDLVDSTSKELGFNIEQNARVKDMLSQVMEKAGIFDTRTKEQIELERQDWKNAELKKLGDNAQQIITDISQFVKDNNMFNENEKEALLKAADKDANVIAAVYKLKKLIRGVGQVPIVNAEISGLADDYALAEEYNDSKTTQTRRLEIIKQRRAAGRIGGLPVLKR